MPLASKLTLDLALTAQLTLRSSFCHQSTSYTSKVSLAVIDERMLRSRSWTSRFALEVAGGLGPSAIGRFLLVIGRTMAIGSHPADRLEPHVIVHEFASTNNTFTSVGGRAPPGAKNADALRRHRAVPARC